MKRKQVLLVLVALPAAFVAVVYFLPILNLFATVESWTAYREILADAFVWEILGNTFLFAAKVTFAALAIGYPIAALASSSGGRLGRVILLCATLPLWTSLLARSYAWLAVLDRRGFLNTVLSFLHITDTPLELSHTTFAALVSSVYIMLPMMVLSLYAQMHSIDLNVVQAARTLGASRLQAFIRIYLPLSVPGVVSGSLLVFILSLGFFVTPALLGGPQDRTFSMLIAQQIDRLGDFQAAAVLSILLLLATSAFLLIFGRVVGFEQFVGRSSSSHVPQSRGLAAVVARAIAPVEHLLRIFGRREFWIATVIALVALVSLPYVVLLPMSLSGGEYLQFPPDGISLRWYAALVTDQRWVSAATMSLTIAVGAALISTAVGLAAAMGLRELSGAAGRVLLVLLMLPAMIPTMIYSIASYFAAVQAGLLGTRVSLVLAHAALAVPFVVIICSTALGGIKASIEQAAQSLGAHRFTRFYRITLPLILPSVLTSALVAFQTSFDEVVVALFLSGVQTRTLPKLMWQASTMEVSPIIPAASIAVLVVVIVVAGMLMGLSRLQRMAR